MNIRHFRAKNRGRRLRRRPLRCLWGFCAKAFARGLSRESRSFGPTRQSREASFSRVSFSGRSRQSSRDAARGHPSSARRRRSRMSPSSRDASFFAYLSVVPSVVPSVARRDFSSQAPASAPPPPPRLRLRRLRRRRLRRRRRSRRLFVADDARQPPGGPSGASPARVGHEPTALPETPAVAEAPGVPAGACLRRRRPLRGSGFLFPQNLGERNESAGSFGPSRAQTRRRRPGRRRVFMRQNGFATRPHGREEFRVVFPRRLAAAPVRAARPLASSRAACRAPSRPPPATRRRAPAPRPGAYTGPDALAVSMFRAAVAAYLRARAAASRASRSCAAAISRSEGDAAAVPGDGDPAAPGSPGIPGDDRAPAARRRRAPRVAPPPPPPRRRRPRLPARRRPPARRRGTREPPARDADAGGVPRRRAGTGSGEPAGPSAIMRECGVGGSARLRAFATPRAVRASSQLTGYAHGTSFATLECSLASSLRSREGSAASSRAFVFAEFSFFFSSAPERRSEGNRRNVFVSFALETSPSVSARNAASASSLATRASASSSADHVSRTRRVSAGTPASASPPRSAKTASAFRVANRRQCAAAPRRRRSPRTPAARTPSVRRS